MRESTDGSFRFMEELIAFWLAGAHAEEIVRVLEVVQAEARRRGIRVVRVTRSPDQGRGGRGLGAEVL